MRWTLLRLLLLTRGAGGSGAAVVSSAAASSPAAASAPAPVAVVPAPAAPAAPAAARVAVPLVHAARRLADRLAGFLDVLDVGFDGLGLLVLHLGRDDLLRRRGAAPAPRATPAPPALLRRSFNLDLGLGLRLGLGGFGGEGAGGRFHVARFLALVDLVLDVLDLVPRHRRRRRRQLPLRRRRLRVAPASPAARVLPALRRGLLVSA